MNSIGKKVFHFLFLIAVLLSCRVCAAQLFAMQQNFKCPICILIKGKPSISFHLTPLSKNSLTNVQVQTVKREFAQQNSFAEQTIESTNNLKILYSFFALPFNTTQRNSKPNLYILYQQLKIGNCFLFIISSIKKTIF
jgi:hypothetical protein